MRILTAKRLEELLGCELALALMEQYREHRVPRLSPATRARMVRNQEIRRDVATMSYRAVARKWRLAPSSIVEIAKYTQPETR
jgi:hypothetical protein